MKIYLCARYSRREELGLLAQELLMLGHTITSQWLLGTHDADSPTDVDRCKWAQEDLHDLYAAEMLVAFTEDRANLVGNPGRGGRHVEFGLAYGLGLRLVVIGPRENVFHCLPLVRQFGTFAEFLESGIV